MTLADKLNLLKMDVGIASPAYDARLIHMIESSEREIERMGACLEIDNPEDDNLVIQLAAWMWRNRESGEDLPRYLTYAINNRIFSQKMRER